MSFNPGDQITQNGKTFQVTSSSLKWDTRTGYSVHLDMIEVLDTRDSRIERLESQLRSVQELRDLAENKLRAVEAALRDATDERASVTCDCDACEERYGL